MNPIKNFNNKHKKFLEFIAKGENYSVAAKKAGYTNSYAEHCASDLFYALLENIGAKTYFHMLQEKTVDHTIADIKECKQGLTEMARDYENEPKDRLKAYELLMKASGAFTDKVELSGPGGGPLDFRWQGDDG